MSEGLQLKSRGFPFKGGTGRGRAPEGPRAPVSTVRICVKCAGTATRHGCDPANYPQNLTGGGAMYASGAGKGRSSGGTPSGRNRQSYGLGRGQVFLEVVRCGSFRSAAERPELSIKVVRRRIDDFERQVGATLFTRDVHGTRLTDEGSLISCFGSRTHGGRLVRPAAPAIPSPTRFRAKSGSPSPKVWERFGWPLALSTSSNRSRTFLSISTLRCAPPTYRGMRPTCEPSVAARRA